MKSEASDLARMLDDRVDGWLFTTSGPEIPEDWIPFDFWATLQDRVDPVIRSKLLGLENVRNIEGENVKDRQKARDQVIQAVFERDIYGDLGKEDRNALRSCLVMLFECIQMRFSSDIQIRLNQQFGRGIRMWVIFKDPFIQDSEQVAIGHVRAAYNEDDGLAKVHTERHLAEAISLIIV